MLQSLDLTPLQKALSSLPVAIDRTERGLIDDPVVIQPAEGC